MVVDFGDDPGWQLSWKTFVSALAPGRGLASAQNGSGASLTLLRSLFVRFSTAVMLIGVVVLILGDIDPEQPDRPGLTVPIVIAVGLVCLVLQRIVPGPLDCSTPAALAASYRRRFFLRIAFAEACSLAAFALYIAFGPGWVYAVGLVFTLAGLMVAAPTRARLRADQDALGLRGCTLSLVAALRAP